MTHLTLRDLRMTDALDAALYGTVSHVQKLEAENRKLIELLNLASNHVPLSQLTLRENIDAALSYAAPPPPTQGEENLLMFTREQFDAALRQCAAEAREECAKIVEDYSRSYGGEWPALDRIKAAIRARIKP